MGALNNPAQVVTIGTDVTAIRAVTDNLPNEGVLSDITNVTSQLPDGGTLTSISDETDKIDNAAATGLLGVDGSLSYVIQEIDRHNHHYTRCFGLAAVPSGETHRADNILTNPAPFVIDAGNNTWGAWVQVFGSSDTPAGWVEFDPHEFSIVGVETANVTYFIQIGCGDSGADSLTAGTYSEFVFRPQSANGRPAAIPVGLRRQDAGTKVWMRTLARGENTATIDVYLEMHGYEG